MREWLLSHCNQLTSCHFPPDSQMHWWLDAQSPFIFSLTASSRSCYFCHDENHVQTHVFFDWTFECEKLPKNQSLGANLQRSWKDIEKTGPFGIKTFSIGLFFTHLLTAKTLLKPNCHFIRRVLLARRAPGRSIEMYWELSGTLTHVWISVVKATVEADLSFSAQMKRTVLHLPALTFVEV